MTGVTAAVSAITLESKRSDVLSKRQHQQAGQQHDKGAREENDVAGGAGVSRAASAEEVADSDSASHAHPKRE
eukprot:CAMPEP_0177788400 /NCGR_PEP_ID=MMETSP0491_2-20121128/22094_1 /TAXON_ID=63592 /ORGANISM="Tetraselmis chuii, Strain PLY429" /LENGTH=72 /DNA_ID=CAMNT_0019309991 /DNA_START=169 /DNA_END=388 /DNA_ORIENTATION=+